MTCMKCKHWKRNTFCNSSYGECTNDKFTLFRYNEIDDAVVFGSNAPLGDAWFETGALFGCIHFIEKEK